MQVTIVDEEAPTKVTTQIGPWAMVPAWVLKYLKGSELAVYVALRTFADREGYGYPKTKTIADRAGVAIKTCRTAIQNMRRLEIVHTKERHRGDGSLAGYDYFLVDIEPDNGRGVLPGEHPKPPAETQETAAQTGYSQESTPLLPGEHPRTHQINTPVINSLNTENSSSLVPTVADQPEPVDKTEEEEFPKELKSFVANLDYGSQIPSRAEFVRIAKAAKKLHAVVNTHDLKARLTANMRGVDSPVAVYITRLNELTIDDFLKRKPSPRRNHWCQRAEVCDPNSRRVIDSNGFISREPCPVCGVRAETTDLVSV